MNFTRWRLVFAAGSMILAAGCGDPMSSNPPPADGGDDVTDASGKDTGTETDVGFDGGTVDRPDVVVADNPKLADNPTEDTADVGGGDTGPDVTADTGVDTGPDVALDAGSDAAPDVGMDVPADVRPDVAADVPADARPDAPADVPADAPPAACAMPRGTITLPSMAAVSVTGTTVGGTNSFRSTRCQGNTGGPDAVYSLVVTARTGVILSTDNAGTANGFDTTLSIRRNCLDAESELACDDDSGAGTGRPNTSVLRAVLDPGTYTVIVDGYSTGSGAYELTARTFTPAANATCSTARALTPGMALTGQTFDNAGAVGTCDPGLRPGGQVFYSLTVPANSSATVQLSRASGSWDFALRAYADCATTACLVNALGSTSPFRQTLINGGTTPRTFILAVASDDSDDAVTPFDIVATVAPLMPGYLCENAVTLTPGMTLAAQSNAGAPVTDARCRNGDTGGQRFYSLTIPAGQRARVTATPTGATPRQPVLRVLDACTGMGCVDATIGGSSTTPAAASLDVPNLGTAPRTVIVSLASTSTANAGAWDLAATLAPIVPGQFCEAPVAVMPGMTLANQNAASGLRVSGACVTAANGGQLFYRVTVPAAQRVQVRAVPAGAMAAWTPTVRVLATCASTTCADSSTAAMAGGPATVTLSNGGTMPQDFLLSVSGTAASSGTFNLEAGAPTALPGYTVDATIAASCDDLSMGTTVMPTGGWTDDSTTAIAALPFPFPFFGTALTRWSINSNGLLQLYPDGSGTTSTAYINTTIPTSATPNGFVAALWDDLRIASASDAGAATTGRFATFGSAGSRRFVVEWTNFTLPAPDNTTRLTFQAKLFEATRVIELHYCAITPMNARAAGNSATIGAEDPSGTVGTQIAHLMTDAVRTGRAFRLTPR